MKSQVVTCSQPGIRIVTVPSEGQLLQSVVALGDNNSKHLGIFPRSAFEREAGKNRVVAAVNEEGSLAGYILYWVARHRAKIQHCCVDASFRGQGVGRKLVDAIKERTRSLPGIELHCARDFKESCRFWEANGFVPVGAKPGRGYAQRELTLFVFDHQNSDLFTSQLDAQADQRLLVVVDTNIAFDWQDEDRTTSPESRALLADWLAPEIDLRITDHAFTDANAQPEVSERKRRMAFLRGLGKVNEERELFERLRDGLFGLFRDQPDDSLQVDIAHIAASISVGAFAFVTHDAELLDRADAIERDYGISVCSPGVLIGRLDEDARSQAYQPTRLGGTPVVSRRLSADDLNETCIRFLNHGNGERKHHLESKVRALLAEPNACDVSVIEWPAGAPVGLVSIDRRNENVLNVPLVRFVPSAVTAVLLRHVIAKFIKMAASEGRATVAFHDQHAWKGTLGELTSLGFASGKNGWQRFVPTGCLSRQSLFARVAELRGTAVPDDSQTEASELERLFWPCKIKGAGIKSFIVSIRPDWAIHLFDEDLAGQRLHGGDPTLMLNTENVYYRSAQQRHMSCPARILWYVSDDGGHDCHGEIRACSPVLDVEIGPAKRLFGKNHRLGVYEWRHVLKTANDDPQADIMAVRFGVTESFKFPLPRKSIEGILKNRGKPMPPLTAPYELEEDCFEEIYRRCRGL